MVHGGHEVPVVISGDPEELRTRHFPNRVLGHGARNPRPAAMFINYVHTL